MQRRRFMISLLSVLAPIAGLALPAAAEATQPVRFRNHRAARRLGLSLPAYTRATYCQAAFTLAQPVGHTDDLEARHRRDLETGDVLVVDGWIVSDAEAAACAQLTVQKGRRHAV